MTKNVEGIEVFEHLYDDEPTKSGAPWFPICLIGFFLLLMLSILLAVLFAPRIKYSRLQDEEQRILAIQRELQVLEDQWMLHGNEASRVKYETLREGLDKDISQYTMQVEKMRFNESKRTPGGKRKLATNFKNFKELPLERPLAQ